MDEGIIVTKTTQESGRWDRRQFQGGARQLALFALIIAAIVALVLLRHGADPLRHVRVANVLALSLVPLFYLSIRLREAPRQL